MSPLPTPHFCILPWVHAHIDHTGEVRACCRADRGFRYGSLRERPFAEIWEGESVRAMRESMLSGNAPEACRDCYELEALGTRSARQQANQTYAAELARVASRGNDSREGIGGPRDLDFRFSNLCNLRCRTCEPMNSTSWYAEGPAVYSVPAPSGTVRPGATREEFRAELGRLLPGLRHIHFQGGEPLIEEEHYLFLDRLIAEGRTEVALSYNTNFSKLSYRHWNALSLWQKFPGVLLWASFDGIGPRAELLRKGVVWQEAERNFLLLRTFAPHVSFRIFPAVSVLNCFHLPDAVERWLELGMVTESNMFEFNFVKGPPFYCIKILSPQERSGLARRYEEFFVRLRGLTGGELAGRIEGEFRRVLSWAGDEWWEQDRAEFRRVSRFLDGSRGEKLVEVLPELATLMEGA